MPVSKYEFPENRCSDTLPPFRLSPPIWIKFCKGNASSNARNNASNNVRNNACNHARNNVCNHARNNAATMFATKPAKIPQQCPQSHPEYSPAQSPVTLLTDLSFANSYIVIENKYQYTNYVARSSSQRLFEGMSSA